MLPHQDTLLASSGSRLLRSLRGGSLQVRQAAAAEAAAGATGGTEHDDAAKRPNSVPGLEQSPLTGGQMPQLAKPRRLHESMSMPAVSAPGNRPLLGSLEQGGYNGMRSLSAAVRSGMPSASGGKPDPLSIEHQAMKAVEDASRKTSAASLNSTFNLGSNLPSNAPSLAKQARADICKVIPVRHRHQPEPFPVAAAGPEPGDKTLVPTRHQPLPPLVLPPQGFKGPRTERLLRRALLQVVGEDPVTAA